MLASIVETALESVERNKAAVGLFDTRALLRDIGSVALGRYLSLPIILICSVFQRRMLGPSLIGLWNILLLVEMYLSFGDLGLIRGAERKLPDLYTNRSENEADTVRDIGFTSALILLILFNLAFLACTFLLEARFDPLLVFGLRVMTVVAILRFISDYLEVAVLRSRRRFTLMSIQLFVAEVFFAIASVAGIYVWGIYGFLASIMAMLVLKIGLIYVTTRDRIGLRFDFSEARDLLRIGVPLTIFALMLKTYENVDKILVVQWLGLEYVGYYSLAFTALVFLHHFPRIVSQVFYPRIMSYIREGNYEGISADHLIRAQHAFAFSMMVMVGGCYFVIPLAIRYLLPAFNPAIPVLKVLLFSAVFAALVQIPIQYIIATGRRWFLVVTIGFLGGAYYVIASTVLSWQFAEHWPMEAIALGKLMTYALIYLLITWKAFRALNDLHLLWRHLAGLLVRLAVFSVVLIFIDSFLLTTGTNWAWDLGIVLLKSTMLLAVLAPLFWGMTRQFELYQKVRTAFSIR